MNEESRSAPAQFAVFLTALLSPVKLALFAYLFLVSQGHTISRDIKWWILGFVVVDVLYCEILRPMIAKRVAKP
jgi:hypothetical protein